MENNVALDDADHSHRPDVKRQDPNYTSQPLAPRARKHRIAIDALLLLMIMLMLAWPWAFYGSISAKGGIQMSPRLAEYALTHPQLTNSIATLLGTFNRILASFLFGCAIVRYGQERAIQAGKPLTVFGVSAFLAFRHMSLMWGIGEWWELFKQGRRFAVIVSLFLCLGATALIPSGTAGLLTPGRFNRTSDLSGREVDFTSTPECEAWLDGTFQGEGCKYMTSQDGHSKYFACFTGSSVTDVLSTGTKYVNADWERNPDPATHVRPVSPISRPISGGSPNWTGRLSWIQHVKFNMLDEWRGSASGSQAKLHYGYTLVQQGLDTEIHCQHDPESPIRYEAIENVTTIVMASTGVCDSDKGLFSALGDVIELLTLNTNSTLTYWACASNRSSPTTDESDGVTYYLYLRGRVEDYTVRYTSTQGYFTAEETLPEPNQNTAVPFLENLIMAMADLIWRGQLWTSHLVAESVLITGQQFFDLPSNTSNPGHLRLLEAMLQGILEYYAMSTRLFVSLNPVFATAPSSCMRPVQGHLTYEVFGWFAAPGASQVGLLIPMTLLNLASLAIYVIAVTMGRFNPRNNQALIDPRSLLAAKVVSTNTDNGELDHRHAKGGRVAWEDRVAF
ncbi:hypothetical protein MD484_g767, partial [Candolleomyces efflorescens]